MTSSPAGCLKIYRFLVNLLPSDHLPWFISCNGQTGLLFLHYNRLAHTHTHVLGYKFLSSFSAFSLQLGPVPSGFWNITLSPFITIFPAPSLSLSVCCFLSLPKLLRACLPLSAVSLKLPSSVLNHQVQRTKKIFAGQFCPVALRGRMSSCSRARTKKKKKKHIFLDEKWSHLFW